MRLIALRQLCGDFGAVGPGQEFEASEKDGEDLLSRRLAEPVPYGPCPRFSIVVPSRDAGNLGPCLQAVHGQDPGFHRIILVDDGVDLAAMRNLLDGGVIVPGIKPFIFARNCNLGIQAAGTDDVLLLNDDALLQTPGGFSALARTAGAHPDYGVISAAVSLTGNSNQRLRPGMALRHERRMVCFVAVYLPRSVINRVGMLDERYVGYGCDDDDYCVSVRAAGLKIGIYDGCVVDHGSLKSTFRGNPKRPGSFQKNLQIFKEKWGHDNWGRPA